MSQTSRNRGGGQGLWRWILGPALLAAAMLLPPHILNIPVEYWRIIRAALVVGAGWAVAGALEGRMRRARFSPDGRRSSLIRLIIRVLFYLLVVGAALGALGLGASSITAGGVVVTAVVGLAGQTLFSNILAGMVIVIWRPFEIGERISIMSWQMPLIAPTYPHETQPSAHVGLRVLDINLLHTICAADDGQTTLIPNSVMLPAIVRNHSHSHRCRVRVRSEAERTIGVDRLWQRLEDLATEFRASEPLCVEPVEPLLIDVSLTGISFVLQTWVPAHEYEELVRARLVLAVARALEGLREPLPAEHPVASGPTAAPGKGPDRV